MHLHKKQKTSNVEDPRSRLIDPAPLKAIEEALDAKIKERCDKIRNRISKLKEDIKEMEDVTLINNLMSERIPSSIIFAYLKETYKREYGVESYEEMKKFIEENEVDSDEDEDEGEDY